MTIDEAVDTFGYQANVIDYAVEQGVKKGDFVLLWDKVSNIFNKRPSKDQIFEIETLIAGIAAQTYDEKIMTMLLEMKGSLKEFK